MSLESERKSISLDMENLTRFLYSYIYPTLPLCRVRHLRSKILTIPSLSLDLSRYYDSKHEQLIRALKFGQSWRKFVVEENLSPEESFIGLENSNELSPYLSHYLFFSFAVQLQGSDEQVREWLPLINSGEIFGCYAQTELGHGSNVKGLETEAIYDHKNQEFVMNTPSDSACKFWIGALGNSSNHAVLIAQLKIDGKSYGPHAFLVPVRDKNTHEPLEGIEIGDMGPKIGIHTADNGFLRMKAYRIPKKNMLNRFVKIDENGKYRVLDPNYEKLLYLSLMHARIMIVSDAWQVLGSSLTISIRYSITRHQFSDPEDPSQEKRILDYQIQRHKLFKPLSLCYAFTFARVPVISLYEQTKIEVAAGNDANLAFTHCLLCLYKVYLSYDSITAIESCRRSCGGHGYLMISGLPSIYTTFLPKVTYDGDNSILALQAIKYLISLFSKNNKPDLFKYIYQEKVCIKGHFLSTQFQHKCIEAIAQYKMQKLYQKYLELSKKFKKEKIWNDFIQIEGIDAAESVYIATVHYYFSEAVSKIESLVNKEAVDKLRFVYAAGVIEKNSAILSEYGVDLNDLDLLKAESIEALKFIAKNALGLVEAYELKDQCLNSIIGRSDGDIYKHMLAEAKYKNPLNKTKVFPDITSLIRPKI